MEVNNFAPIFSLIPQYPYKHSKNKKRGLIFITNFNPKKGKKSFVRFLKCTKVNIEICVREMTILPPKKRPFQAKWQLHVNKSQHLSKKAIFHIFFAKSVDKRYTENILERF